jgi:proline iminopeptidase
VVAPAVVAPCFPAASDCFRHYDRWVEPHTGFVTAGRASLFVREVGEGLPVVVLHGGPTFDCDYLLPELDALAGHARLVYYDQRGRGRSTDGVRPEDVGIDSDVEDLDVVRRHLGWESVALLGHSWGGLLAMEYATRHPHRVSHLVLMNSAPATHEGLVRFRDHLRQVRRPGEEAAMDALEATEAFRAGDLAVETACDRIHFRPTVHDPDLLERLLPRLRRNYTPEKVLAARAIMERLYEQTWATPGYDLLPRLSRLDAPTLVLHAEHDFIPVETVAPIADAVPGARLVVLPGVGHFAYLEDTDAVVREVRALLAH